MVASPTVDERHHSGRRRLGYAVVTGVAAGVVAAFFVPWELALILGWDAACIVVIWRAWYHAGRLGPPETRQVATMEDNTRTLTDVLLILCCVISLAGVVFAFLKANDDSTDWDVVLELFGVLTIVLSWFVVHVIFSFKYADAYYRAPEGGIDFGLEDEDADPDYRDFAYLAFTVGMTYQVADTGLTQRRIRRLVLGHALLSFLFGAVILATTVNLVASLFNT